jgi:hypothetical protein
MYTIFMSHLQYADQGSPPEGLKPPGEAYGPRSSTRHLCATLGALFLVAGLTDDVRHSVPTTGADTVAARPGGLGATHATGPTSAAATRAAATSASASTTLTHLNHLLLSSTLALAPFGARPPITHRSPRMLSTAEPTCSQKISAHRTFCKEPSATEKTGKPHNR